MVEAMMALVALFRSIVLDAGRRLAMTLAGYLMAGGFMAVGIIFLTLAGYRALAQGLGDVAAALIVGGAYIVASLIALVALRLGRR